MTAAGLDSDAVSTRGLGVRGKLPEAPELEVVKDFLDARVVGAVVVSATVLRPSVIRPVAGDLASDLAGRAIDSIRRRGKFLLFGLSGDRLLVVNPMLTGAFQYCGPAQRKYKRTCFILSLSTGEELRYLDDRQMGRVYYVSGDQLDQVPQLNDMGPDVLDAVPVEEFRRRLSRFHGEIKGILTRGRVISGIGNAYADEILFRAKIYPFRKRKLLTEDEVGCLHQVSREVIEGAIPAVRDRIGERIHLKARDFFKSITEEESPAPGVALRSPRSPLTSGSPAIAAAASQGCFLRHETVWRSSQAPRLFRRPALKMRTWLWQAGARLICSVASGG